MSLRIESVVATVDSRLASLREEHDNAAKDTERRFQQAIGAYTSEVAGEREQMEAAHKSELAALRASLAEATRRAASGSQGDRTRSTSVET